MSYKEKTDHYMEVITRQMENLGYLEDADRENLDLLRTQISLYYRALEDLEENGLTCHDKVGRLTVNPAFNIQRSAICNVISLLKELSISARQRRMLIKDEITEEHDPLDDFLADMRNERM